ncbi:MAG: hypothetical protein Q4F10_06220 [Corynebacterium glutamicum]|uniref:hypothetical protein n=1 Tax=Corynebacterium glutamicum TaxID=1718 RepID=UPI00146508B6|nr:hypothetical protein [Corynebacterium glutamicum]MDO5373031.1 hypothetical protein [Corynebacterium glutamicum]GFK19201.1 hypothetical protein KbCgl_17730 [Corynebacterium glutamicum]
MAKAGKPRIVIDSDRLMEWVRKAHTKTVHDTAEDVAETVRSKLPEDVEVVVNDHISAAGRPVSVVTIIHPSGMARQARDGILTRSAAEHGLTITRTEDG